MTTRQQQRGAALLTAMIIVTLVASLAAAMAWRQQRAVQVEAADRARAQAEWILKGSLDWARLILREDANSNRTKEAVDHLGEPWAVPLAEARLSTFLAAEKNATEEGPEAFLSGQIEDAQARYNLRNLLVADPKALEIEQRTLERLCEGAGVPTDTAALIITKMRAAFPVPGNEPQDAPLQPRRIEQLIWFGLAPATVERLRPLLSLLPVPTPVNLNTAPREVIAALFDGMSLADAERIVRTRQSSPFKTVQDVKSLLPETVQLSAERASVQSSYFFVSGRLRLEERVLEERSLVWRNGMDMQVLDRQRISPQQGS